MHVVSMSLGASRPPVLALTRMVQRLNRAGITVVAAAGNSYGTNFPYVNTPANCPGVIAVGALDDDSLCSERSCHAIFALHCIPSRVGGFGCVSLLLHHQCTSGSGMCIRHGVSGQGAKKEMQARNVIGDEKDKARNDNGKKRRE